MKYYDEKTPADRAWAMFEKTGEINYYMLYKKLMEK